MKLLSIPSLITCLILGISITGCRSKVSFEEEATIDKESAGYHKIIDGPKSDQKVRIEIIGASETVNVFVFLGKDEASAQKDIDIYKVTSSSWLAYKLKVKDAVLEVSIPAKQEIHVFIQPVEKSAKVKVKVNSY